MSTQLRQVSNYIDEHRRAISAQASKSRSAESHKVELSAQLIDKKLKPVSTIQKKYQNYKNS